MVAAVGIRHTADHVQNRAVTGVAKKKWSEPPCKPGALGGVHAGPRRVANGGQIKRLRFRGFLADQLAGSLFR